MSSSIENIENVVVMKVKAKSFAQKDKKTMFSIMAFIKYLEEQGILPDDKILECLEALPLYKTAADKTAFFQHEMFNIKVVENELYKPMVSDYKNAKKEAKKEKKVRVIEPKPKKEKSEQVDDVKVDKPKKEKSEQVDDVKVDKPKKERKPKEKKEGDETESKRGRKPKQQIVELAQDVVHTEEKDQFDALIQSMNEKKVEVAALPVPEEYSVNDIDEMLAELELEAEEIVEKKVNTPIIKEKKSIKMNADTDPVKVIKKSKKTNNAVFPSRQII